MEKVTQTVYLSLGTNIGNKLDNLQNAIRLLNNIGKTEAISHIYETTAWGYESENSYYNCCIQLATELNAEQLLQETQLIEKQLGRVKTDTYTDRPIDIDILLIENQVINKEFLQIPHPLMTKRAFVLTPLNDIAATIVHPQHFLTIKQLLANLQSSEVATRINTHF